GSERGGHQMPWVVPVRVEHGEGAPRTRKDQRLFVVPERELVAEDASLVLRMRRFDVLDPPGGPEAIQTAVPSLSWRPPGSGSLRDPSPRAPDPAPPSPRLRRIVRTARLAPRAPL